MKKNKNTIIWSLLIFLILPILIPNQINNSQQQQNNTINNKISRTDVPNFNIEKNQPEAQAFYHKIEFGTQASIDLGIAGFNHTIITDGYKGKGIATTDYFFTGYTTNTTDNQSTLFVIRTDASGNILSANLWRAPSYEYGNATGGLSIAVDETNSRIYIGGFFYEANVSSRFHTTGAGLLLRWDNLFASGTPTWWKTFYKESNQTDWPDDESTNYDFGGERIEDIMLMPDGNLTIAGGYLYNETGSGYKTVNSYAAKIDTDDGSTIWEYLAEDINTASPGSTFYSCVAKKILLRESSSFIYLIEERKEASVVGTYYQNLNYFITAIYYNTTDTYLTPTSGDVAFRKQQTQNNIYSSDYTKLSSILFDKNDNLWAVGTIHTGDGIGSNIAKIWQLDATDPDLTYSSLQNIVINSNNHTAEELYIDENNTFYIIGNYYDGTSSQEGLWLSNIDPDRNYYEIGISELQLGSGYNFIYIGNSFDESTKLFSIWGTYISGTVGVSTEQLGVLVQTQSAATIPNEVLTPLSSYTTENDIQLQWTNNHSELRYFYIYRSTEPISTFTDLNGSTPIAVLEWTYEYVDTVQKNDTQEYYYALVCGNDNGNSTTLETTSTRYFDPLDKPYPMADKDTFYILGERVTLTWNTIENATYYVYASRETIDPTNLTGFQEQSYQSFIGNGYIFANESTTIRHLPSKVGTWYYLIEARNGTERGSSFSNVITVDVQDIAKAPSWLEPVVLDEGAGIVHLSWEVVSGCDYIIYKSDIDFDINSDPDNYSYVATVIGEYNNEYTISDLPSGIWFFAVWAINTTGNATSFSETKSVEIHRVPTAPRIYLLSPQNTHDPNIKLSWDNTSETDYYAVYRSFSPSGVGANLITSIDNLIPIYNGTDLNFTDTSPKNDGTYVYTVIAFNENGHSVLIYTDPDYYAVVVYSGEVSQTLWDNSAFRIVVITGSIFGIVAISYAIWKKRNPW